MVCLCIPLLEFPRWIWIQGACQVVGHRDCDGLFILIEPMSELCSPPNLANSLVLISEKPLHDPTRKPPPMTQLQNVNLMC